MARPKTIASRAPTAVDRHVGSVIRKLRKDANMTLEELGQSLGITHQQLQKYETGANRVSAGMLWQMSSVLRHPVEGFFPGGGVDDDLPARCRRAEGSLAQIRKIVEA